MDPPSFPTDFITEKVRRLGYGSGPWQREALVALWGDATADKFVRDAKEAGWLVSPQRGTYFVPAASDLMTVSWLSPALRYEYLVARTLASTGLRFWCLSAWCRDQGLDLGGPVFVTDLSTAKVTGPSGPPQSTAAKQRSEAKPGAPPSLAKRRDRARARAAKVASLPCLDELLIVPRMPPVTVASPARRFLAPEAPEAQNQKKMMATMTAGALALASLAPWVITKEWSGMDGVEKAFKMDDTARSIPYSLGPAVTDKEWIFAVLAALGIARTEELALQAASKASGVDKPKLAAALALLGPPQPNADWERTIQTGPFPYLLAPPVLWKQMGADQAARRARTADRLGAASLA